MSKIYFFRHAQASLGAANYDVLSPKGEVQAAILGRYLAKKKYVFDKIYVGPLRRQQHTFEIVQEILKKEKLPVPEPVFLDGLKEHQATKAMKKAMPELIKTVPLIKEAVEEAAANPELKKVVLMRCFQYFVNEWATDRIKVEGVLPWKEFRKDVKEGLEIILQNTNSKETIAAFTSGGTISAITGEALQIQDEQRVAALNFSIRNTSYTSFLYSQGAFNLLGFNEISHLPSDMVTFV